MLDLSHTLRSYLITTVILFSLQLTVFAQATKSDKYVEAGIPAASREWFGSDYARAYETFASGRVSLPRFSETQGAKLLERMTSIENFSFHRNRSIPLQTRMEDYLRLMKGANSVLKLYYANAVNEKEKLYTEMARLLGFMLQVSALGVELVDESIPTIPRDDKYATRMDALRRFYSDLTTVFVGAEVSLSERNYYSQDDLSAILDAMAITLPRLKKAFAQDYRIELRKKLESDAPGSRILKILPGPTECFASWIFNLSIQRTAFGSPVMYRAFSQRP
jgi:hypothetical protein